jgi:hypothetical protein
MLRERPSKLLNLRKSDIELLRIDYEVMSQYLALMKPGGERSPEEKKNLIRRMREEMRFGNTAGQG